jgi:nucleotide-binding universal stress UspA family protein
MRTILVPTDFSECAQNALNVAAHLAGYSNATIHLLHVVEAVTTQTFNTMGIVEVSELERLYHLKLIGAADRKLDEIVTRKEYKNIKIKQVVLVGKPYDNISEHIVEHDADMVIMGTKGSEGLEEMLVGSNTEKVIRFSNCPVMSVPCPVNLENWGKIVFLTEEVNKEEQVVDVVRYFQRVCNASIELLWVSTPHVVKNEMNMRVELEKFATENELVNCTAHVRKGVSVEEGINSFADEVNADLIVMATHGRKGLLHLIRGSLAEDIVNHSKRPVVTVSLKS